MSREICPECKLSYGDEGFPVKPRICKVCEEKKPNYKKAYHLLMEYWDSLPDEEKEDINNKLRGMGL